VAEKFVDDVRQGTKDLLSNPESTKDSKTAAIYGMAASVPDKTLVEDVAFAFLDSCFATPSLPTGDADSHHHNGKESKADKHSSSANGWAKAK
uniref:Uncharacterized protein n=1 Tax=Plectus sambesii TaxID=2011161 RepID=A0A914WYW5_9BILA